jgi:hypothetical protein
MGFASRRTYATAVLDTLTTLPFHSTLMRTPNCHCPICTPAPAASCGIGSGTTITTSTTTVVRRVVRE